MEVGDSASGVANRASREGLYARVLERRIWPIVDPRIQEEQCGFSSRSWNTGPALYYTLRRVLEGFGAPYGYSPAGALPPYGGLYIDSAYYQPQTIATPIIIHLGPQDLF
ncbi:hypothetical protein L3Q82_023380 [Scortum barcoo]|uniref:Uncharacterized protein n=1 Tax=Scortum barcoo TaxID=214431 RepID=A0ACB8WYN5_9TELE|nr:hypothetical protein L3Q82_023380 [Scortum barcoo]